MTFTRTLSYNQTLSYFVVRIRCNSKTEHDQVLLRLSGCELYEGGKTWEGERDLTGGKCERWVMSERRKLLYSVLVKVEWLLASYSVLVKGGVLGGWHHTGV